MNRPRIVLIAAALLAGASIGGPALAAAPIHGTAEAIEGRAVWIFDLAGSAGGSAGAIAAQARTAGVRSVFVKAADGASLLRQYSAAVVSDLRADGLNVCAWQFVYGRHPAAEAAAAVAAVRAGAQCLIVDAEASYEGRYWAARRYMRDLRAGVGRAFPVGLASFPFVTLHPWFPYSQFLGPGGAQFDMPQMYWQAIGASIDGVFARTFVDNRLYGRPIVPVGQAFGRPAPAAIARFRALTVAYGAPGISWWDWAWASQSALWGSLSALLRRPTHFRGPDESWPVLSAGSRGDPVIWLQEHLAREDPAQRVTGLFAGQTRADLAAFQARRRLPVTGRTNPATWRALLELDPVSVIWPAPGAHA
ncbi:MAG: peptidoglycan-binding domain-containing protein [Solirubrobacteraceae bacterium]